MRGGGSGLPSVFATGYAGTSAMARGDGGKPAFEDAKDRYAWVDLQEKACERFGWRVHAWVLIRKRTGVKNRWAAGRLAMGHEGNVTRTIRRADDQPVRRKNLAKLETMLVSRECPF